MTTTTTPSTHRATVAIGDEQTARRRRRSFDRELIQGGAAISAFEGPQGRWDITVHFADAPDQGAVRDLVGLAAGEEIGQAIQFDTVEAKDWVATALEGLVRGPCRALRRARAA